MSFSLVALGLYIRGAKRKVSKRKGASTRIAAVLRQTRASAHHVRTGLSYTRRFFRQDYLSKNFKASVVHVTAEAF